MRGTSPWMSMLSHADNRRPFCGGSLIGNKWILTAAHCLHKEIDPDSSEFSFEDIFPVSSFNIILGKHRTLKQDDTEQIFQSKSIIIHPNYNSSTFQNDIGLLELANTAFLNDYVMPVCLPQEEIQPDEYAMVSGWGKQFLRKLPEALTEIEIPVVPYDLCKNIYVSMGKVVTEDMICAGLREGGKDACSGDSGGPMVTLSQQRNNWYLAGTVSWGVGCGESDKFGVYSNVYKNVNWIRAKSGIHY